MKHPFIGLMIMMIGLMIMMILINNNIIKQYYSINNQASKLVDVVGSLVSNEEYRYVCMCCMHVSKTMGLQVCIAFQCSHPSYI